MVKHAALSRQRSPVRSWSGALFVKCPGRRECLEHSRATGHCGRVNVREGGNVVAHCYDCGKIYVKKVGEIESTIKPGVKVQDVVYWECAGCHQHAYPLSTCKKLEEAEKECDEDGV